MSVTKTEELFHQDDVARATRILAVDSAGNPIGGGVGTNVFVTNTAVDPVPITFPPGVVVGLDAPTLAALEMISVIVTSMPAVALDAATLAALETINAVVSGTVELGATTLAALETIQANCTQVGTWTVALDAATLAALETINAVVTGTVSISGSVAVTGPLTDTQLRATPVPISGTVATGGLTDTQLRATPVPVSGTVTITDGSGPVTVDGTVIATQGTTPWTSSLDAATLAALESVSVQNGAGAAAVNIQDGGNSITVDGTVTVANPGLTDAQLRAVPVPVSGTVTVNQPVTTKELNQLVPFQYDFVDLNYTGDDVTQVLYRVGGSGGTLVATLTLVYSSPGVLDTVTRT